MTQMTQLPPPPPVAPPPSPGAPRRLTRGLIAVAALAIAAAAGGAIGWVLHPTAPAAPATVTAEPAPSAFTPDQARQRACDAYATLGPLWSSAYHEWAGVVSVPGWQWDDPKVRDATDRFRATQGEIVARIEQLIAPSTPANVRDAIHGYTAAILTYSAGFGVSTGEQMTAQEHSIDAAVATADKACGLPTG